MLCLFASLRHYRATFMSFTDHKQPESDESIYLALRTQVASKIETLPCIAQQMVVHSRFVLLRSFINRPTSPKRDTSVHMTHMQPGEAKERSHGTSPLIIWHYSTRPLTKRKDGNCSQYWMFVLISIFSRMTHLIMVWQCQSAKHCERSRYRPHLLVPVFACGLVIFRRQSRRNDWASWWRFDRCSAPCGCWGGSHIELTTNVWCCEPEHDVVLKVKVTMIRKYAIDVCCRLCFPVQYGTQ